MTPEETESTEASLKTLENQLQHSAMHLHSVLSGFADRVNSMEAMLYGLADALVTDNVLTADSLEAYTRRVAQEIAEKGQQLVGGAVVRIDKGELPTPEPVNCAERIHVCQAVCCKLNFPLSAAEIESGKIKWELGRPYFVRHGKNGYCVHIDQQGGGCGCSIYSDRPAVCKQYSCREDKRIWKDFEAMELNTEWLEAHVGEDKMRFISSRMDGQ